VKLIDSTPTLARPHADLTDDELTSSVALLLKRLRALEKAGPGAGMAAAATAIHLRKLQDEARSRGLEL